MSIRVLVVDDDPQVRRLICHNLDAAGHEVFDASDAATALRLQCQLTFDIAVLDVILPDLQIHDLVRGLHNLNRDTRFLLISGHDESYLLRTFRTANLLPFLQKPFDRKTLITAVQDVALQAECELSAVPAL